MATFVRSILLLLVLTISLPREAWGGMPSVTLADISNAARTVKETGLTGLARQRVEVLSFFLLGLLLCAEVIRSVWNGLRRDFPRLPRLSYARAFGIIVLWGLLFVLVLTMISGARELMTPGAWEKNGLTYRLVQTPPPPIEAEITARYETIHRLGKRLLDYAKAHEGAFPTPEQAHELGELLWRSPMSRDGRYIYVSGLKTDSEFESWPTLLAYESATVGDDRLVLMTDGEVRWLPASEIERVRSLEKR
jgi:hypothetical protein